LPVSSYTVTVFADNVGHFAKIILKIARCVVAAGGYNGIKIFQPFNKTETALAKSASISPAFI
jgi:hypothetical protein